MDLFPPIYKINTFDIFAVDESKGWTQLYSSLRPDFQTSVWIIAVVLEDHSLAHSVQNTRFRIFTNLQR